MLALFAPASAAAAEAVDLSGQLDGVASERRAKNKQKKARALTADELLDMLGKLDTDDEAQKRDLPDLVRFLVATGERRGEALGAHWSDFDAEAEALTMTGNLVEIRGKGRVRNSGKSETALGEVDPDEPIFPNSRGGYLNASNLNNRYWIPFRERAGYEWLTFHTLRKTVGTLLDDAGLTARQIADVLGHSHPSMTLNNYMGRGQRSRASADALNKVVNRASD